MIIKQCLLFAILIDNLTQYVQTFKWDSNTFSRNNLQELLKIFSTVTHTVFEKNKYLILSANRKQLLLTMILDRSSKFFKKQKTILIVSP